MKRLGNGPPLRIEHGRFESHKHPCTHTAPLHGVLPRAAVAKLRRYISAVEHTVENLIDVSKLLVEIERAPDLSRRQNTADIRVGEQELLEIEALVEGSHGVA